MSPRVLYARAAWNVAWRPRSDCLFLLCAAVVGAWSLSLARRRPTLPWSELGAVAALTALAAVLRFEVASANLMDFGGVPYSRLLRGSMAAPM